MCSGDLCKLGKVYINALTCKFYTFFSRQNCETFDISHVLAAKLSTVKTVRFFGPPCIYYAKKPKNATYHVQSSPTSSTRRANFYVWSYQPLGHIAQISSKSAFNRFWEMGVETSASFRYFGCRLIQQTVWYLIRMVALSSHAKTWR